MCPVCNKELKEWFGIGGQIIIGCSDIKCDYLGVVVK